MKKHAYTFLPGVGIYNLANGERQEIFSLEKAKRVFSVFSHLATGGAYVENDDVVIAAAKKMYAEHGAAESQKFVDNNYLAFDFSAVEAVGTHIVANQKCVDWDSVKEYIKSQGFILKRRHYISQPISDLCPVYELVNAAGEVIAEGKGFSEEQAEKSALAEAVERIVAGRKPSQLIVDKADRLFKDKKYFFSPELGPRDSYASGIITEWVPAHDLLNKESTYFPADLAYYQYQMEAVRLKLFGFSHTTGLAAGSSKEEAIISGLFEVIERDGYWITMRTHINHPDIPLKQVAGMNEKILKIKDELKQNGFDLVVKDMSMDWGVPVAHAVMVDLEGRIPAFAHGVGAGFSWQVAVERAVAEVLQMYSGMRKVTHEYEGWKHIASMNQVMGNPLLAWSDPLFAAHVRFLTESSKEIWNKDLLISSFDEIERLIKMKKYTVLVSSLGEKDGLEVVRVWLDKATSSDQRLERIGQRLSTYKEKLGLKDFYATPILT